MSYGGWSGSLCWQVFKKRHFHLKTRHWPELEVQDIFSVWLSLPTPWVLHTFWQNHSHRKKVHRKEMRTWVWRGHRELKHKWAFSNEPSRSASGSSSPFCSPFPLADADIWLHFPVVQFYHLVVLLHEINGPWLCEACLCDGDVSRYSFYKINLHRGAAEHGGHLCCFLSMHLSWIFSSCFLKGCHQRRILVLPPICRTSRPQQGEWTKGNLLNSTSFSDLQLRKLLDFWSLTSNSESCPMESVINLSFEVLAIPFNGDITHFNLW